MCGVVSFVFVCVFALLRVCVSLVVLCVCVRLVVTDRVTLSAFVCMRDVFVCVSVCHG